MIMVALVRSWQDLAKILASIPMHLGKHGKIRVTGGPFGGKKIEISRAMPKKLKGGPSSLVRFCR